MPTKKRWMYVPPKPAKPKIPDELKLEVQRKADQFLESHLKPTFIRPPPEDDRSYIVELFTSWHQGYFYFCSKYRCPRPNCISEFFESRFARLEFVGNPTGVDLGRVLRGNQGAAIVATVNLVFSGTRKPETRNLAFPVIRRQGVSSKGFA